MTRNLDFFVFNQVSPVHVSTNLQFTYFKVFGKNSNRHRHITNNAFCKKWYLEESIFSLACLLLHKHKKVKVDLLIRISLQYVAYNTTTVKHSNKNVV